MANSLGLLFKKVKTYGYFTKTNNLDGLDNWNKLKQILSKSSTILKANWNSSIKIHYSYMKNELQIKEDITETINHDTWQKHHFYLQHTRIPILNPNDASIIRLMQIAYNAGQLLAIWDDKIYTDEIKKYYMDNKLEEMTTYMSLDNLTKLNNTLPDNLINDLNILFQL
jgi:hypothetical protein